MSENERDATALDQHLRMAVEYLGLATRHHPRLRDVDGTSAGAQAILMAILCAPHRAQPAGLHTPGHHTLDSVFQTTQHAAPAGVGVTLYYRRP